MRLRNMRVLAQDVRALRDRHARCLSVAEAGVLDDVEAALRDCDHAPGRWNRAERVVRMAESLARIGATLGLLS